MNLVKDWMSKDFKIISGNISSLEAMSLIAGSPYSVIENTNQQAIGVVTAPELEGGIATNEITPVQQLLSNTPLLQVGCDVKMRSVETSPELTTLVRIAKLAIVTDNANQIVGILSADAVRQFIRSSSSQQKGPTLGGDTPYVAGSQLAGSLSPLMASCICRDCWHRNEISAIQWSTIKANPPASAPNCQNPNILPHLLKLK